VEEEEEAGAVEGRGAMGVDVVVVVVMGEGGGGRKGGVEGGGGRAWEEGNVHRKCLCGDDKFILMD
jgi:hypothetical protein